MINSSDLEKLREWCVNTHKRIKDSSSPSNVLSDDWIATLDETIKYVQIMEELVGF